jgi:hypothetical protein
VNHIHLFLRARTPGSTIRQCRCGMNRMGRLRWKEPDWRDVGRVLSASLSGHVRPAQPGDARSNGGQHTADVVATDVPA